MAPRAMKPALASQISARPPLLARPPRTARDRRGTGLRVLPDLWNSVFEATATSWRGLIKVLRERTGQSPARRR